MALIKITIETKDGVYILADPSIMFKADNFDGSTEFTFESRFNVSREAQLNMDSSELVFDIQKNDKDKG